MYISIFDNRNFYTDPKYSVGSILVCGPLQTFGNVCWLAYET